MKLNFTQNFFLKKQFLPIYSGNCTVLIVQSLAQGLFSRFRAGAHLEGAGMGGGDSRRGQGGGRAAGGGRSLLSLRSVPHLWHLSAVASEISHAPMKERMANFNHLPLKRQTSAFAKLKKLPGSKTVANYAAAQSDNDQLTVSAS